MAKRKEFTGKDIGEALENAAGHYDKSLEELQYEVVDGGRKGFLGIGKREAKIVIIEEERRESEKRESDSDRLRQILSRLLRTWRVDLKYNLKEEKSQYKVELYGKDRTLILDQKGKTLDSLQYIVNKLLHTDGKVGKRVVIDSRGFRKNREAALFEMAKRSSEKVKESGKKYELKPLNPYERRIIHLALKDDRKVATYSKGSGFMKKITIVPAKDSKG